MGFPPIGFGLVAILPLYTSTTTSFTEEDLWGAHLGLLGAYLAVNVIMTDNFEFDRYGFTCPFTRPQCFLYKNLNDLRQWV